MKTRQVIERLWRLADEGDLAAERELMGLLRRVGDLEGLAMLGDWEAALDLALSGNRIWGAMLPKMTRCRTLGPTGMKCWQVKANYPKWMQDLKVNPLHLPAIFEVAYLMPHDTRVTVRKQGKHALRVRCKTHIMAGAVMLGMDKTWRSEISFIRCGVEGRGPIDMSSRNTAATSARLARLNAAQWLSERLEKPEGALLTYGGV